jgi:hypothetical protein
MLSLEFVKGNMRDELTRDTLSYYSCRKEFCFILTSFSPTVMDVLPHRHPCSLGQKAGAGFAVGMGVAVDFC